jgi:hypothetical protein
MPIRWACACVNEIGFDIISIQIYRVSMLY